MPRSRSVFAVPDCRSGKRTHSETGIARRSWSSMRSGRLTGSLARAGGAGAVVGSGCAHGRKNPLEVAFAGDRGCFTESTPTCSRFRFSSVSCNTAGSPRRPPARSDRVQRGATLSVKRIVTALLAPAAAFATRAEGLRRAWAHARFASSIIEKLDSSVVILGVPEVHGTGRIALGRDLFLYRDLYFETQQEGSIAIGDNVVISRGVHLVSFCAHQYRGGFPDRRVHKHSRRESPHRRGLGPQLRSRGDADRNRPQRLDRARRDGAGGR